MALGRPKVERSCVLWALALAVLLVLTCTYCIYLQRHLAGWVATAEYLRARRWEPAIVLLFFGAMALAVLCDIIPIGTMLVTAACIGYIYGFRGLAIAWPGVSVGLAVVFGVARLVSTAVGRHQQSTLGTDAVRSRETAFLPWSEWTTAALWGARRLLRESPRRAAVMLTFSTHAPGAQFLLGWATDVRPADALVACAVDGVKAVLPLLKGMVLGDVLDMATAKEVMREMKSVDEVGDPLNIGCDVAVAMSPICTARKDSALIAQATLANGNYRTIV
eukprot:TRINITY_DN3018_c0_g1_i3.p1 TRINITY_DN3018_c0_g1~~TRINITY_DN3018_c0_g1_i3.p1  ORF type:complete len:293 (+),score=37.93 TRINITY_DN3018_c0_g1_i3:51-881(+)